VTALELFDNQLSGSIPPQLSNLAELSTLTVYSNTLSGTIPRELGELDSLANLYVNTNQLSSGIPPELGNMASLKRLVLKSNRLSGGIPPALGDLGDTLEVLYLSCNELGGNIPRAILNLSRLRPHLTDLGYNMLRASDPDVIAFLNTEDPDWAQTQTVPPTHIRVAEVSGYHKPTWIPVAYTEDGGYYEVWGAVTPQGPYELLGRTSSKEDYIYPPGDDELACPECHYVVCTYTPRHGEPGQYVYQQNELRSCSSGMASPYFLPLIARN